MDLIEILVTFGHNVVAMALFACVLVIMGELPRLFRAIKHMVTR